MAPHHLSIVQHGDSFEDDAYDVSVYRPLVRFVCSLSQPPIRSANLSSLASQHAYNWWELCLQCSCPAMRWHMPVTLEASVH